MTLAANGLNPGTKIYTWTYADAAARTGATGFASGDVGSVALQLDDGSLWRLTATTPTWQAFSGGFANPMTTAGDIIYGGASGVPTRLAKGGNNTVLGVDGAGVFGYKADPSGGGGALPYPDTPGADGTGFAEEFDSASPSGFAWSPSTPATADADTTIPDALWVVSSDTTERLYTKTWAAAGAFDLRAKIGVLGAADNGSLSLYCDDGATSGKRLLLYAGWVAGGNNNYIQFYTASVGSFTASGGTVNFAAGVFVPRYYRLVRDGANLVTAYYSHDGILWTVLGTPATLAGTFTRVGVRSANAAHRGYCSWLRANV